MKNYRNRCARWRFPSPSGSPTQHDWAAKPGAGLFLSVPLPILQPFQGLGVGRGEVFLAEDEPGGEGLGIGAGAPGRLALAGGGGGVFGIVPGGEGGARLGFEEERIPLGPSVAAVAGEAQGLLGVVERTGGAVDLGFEQARAAVQHQGVGVDKPHTARGGEGECFGGAVQGAWCILPREGQLTGGDLQAGKIEKKLAPALDGLCLA
jgi:hypothetical protein